jgi:high affinity choline transporter 7
VAATYPWSPELSQRLAEQPADALPMVFKYVTPPFVGFLGLAASSAPSPRVSRRPSCLPDRCFSWNTCTRLLRPDLSVTTMRLVMRTTIALLGVAAVIMALRVQSVQASGFFYQRSAFVCSCRSSLRRCSIRKPTSSLGRRLCRTLVLRLGGGEVLFDIPALIPYPEWVPFRTVAAGAGMLLLPTVSRLTQRLSSSARIGKSGCRLTRTWPRMVARAAEQS